MLDVGKLFSAGYGQCWKAIEYRFIPFLTLLNHYVHAKGNAGSPRLMSANNYVQDNGDVGRPYQTSST